MCGTVPLLRALLCSALTCQLTTRYEMQMSEKYRFTNFWYTKHCGGLKVPHIRIFETTTLIERLPALKSEKGIDTIPKHRVIKTDGMPAEKILGMLAKFSINLPANPPHGEL